jgi:hypothetical protein
VSVDPATPALPDSGQIQPGTRGDAGEATWRGAVM